MLFLLASAVLAPASPAAAGGATETLLNPSFESVAEATGYPEGWGPVWGRPTTCAYSLATARTGGACALVTDNSEKDSHGLRSARVRVRPGAQYAAKVYVKHAKPGGVAVYLEFWNVAGQRVFNRSTGLANAADWTPLSVTGMAPPEAESATVLIYCGSTSTAVAYFDDASLEPAD